MSRHFPSVYVDPWLGPEDIDYLTKAGTRKENHMAVKRIEAESGCFAKAADDEPVFVLRAQDALAPDLVREWANRAEGYGCPAEKTAGARQLADQMEAWPNRKMPD
jgi:hypothetical protein